MTTSAQLWAMNAKFVKHHALLDNIWKTVGAIAVLTLVMVHTPYPLPITRVAATHATETVAIHLMETAEKIHTPAAMITAPRVHHVLILIQRISETELTIFVSQIFCWQIALYADGKTINVSKIQIHVICTVLVLLVAANQHAPNTINVSGIQHIKNVFMLNAQIKHPTNVFRNMTAHGLLDKIQMVQTPVPPNASQRQKYPHAQA